MSAFFPESASADSTMRRMEFSTKTRSTPYSNHGCLITSHSPFHQLLEYMSASVFGRVGVRVRGGGGMGWDGAGSGARRGETRRDSLSIWFFAMFCRFKNTASGKDFARRHHGGFRKLRLPAFASSRSDRHERYICTCSAALCGADCALLWLWCMLDNMPWRLQRWSWPI